VKLKEYNAKRDFSRTKEPRGKIKSTKGKLRFVVQKHDASRIHYDLRLEMGGVYKSWAVPKGPSMNPLDQRLAVYVEDHPLEYGKFEGIIPEGNYGAGTVLVWDTGTYTERKGRGEKGMLEGLASGKLTFVLQGKKLNGEFALIKLKGKDPKAWLLVKKRDEFAVRGESLWDERSVVSGRSMKELAGTQKEVWIPKKGKAESIPRRVRPMFAKITFSFTPGPEWIYEPFYRGGDRVIVEKSGKEIRLASRGILSVTKKYPEIVKALAKVPTETVLDGEIVDKKLILSDLLVWEGKDWREKPLIERKAKLESLKIFNAHIVYGNHATDPAKLKVASGRLIAKKKDGLYRGGISREWLRINQTKGSVQKTDPSLDRPPLKNLEKLYWPDEDISKGDLLRYYDQIADTILPHLKDRPQSLHRQPDGVKNEGFFQKDNPGYVPRRIETTRVYSGSSNKTINYILCQDRWTLLYLVNLGCIELNPWISRKPSLEKPDYSVIDLDPDDNNFEEVIEIARETHAVLKSIGVKSWCKTSGASGLHICIPLGGAYSYDESRVFAEEVCKVVHERHRANTSLERNPARRRGKIYLDYLQNRRGQTLAAPYCVRPRPGATVSTPLDWKEVKQGLDPKAFTIVTMPKRLKRVGDLWTLGGKTNLEAAMKQLSKLTHNSKKR